MESMMAKYADTLKAISSEPDYNRKRALKRFFLLMDFEDNFFPLHKALQGCRLSRTKAISAYCLLREIPVRTFFRWTVDYRKKGIKGLVPRFGTAGKSLYRRCKNKLSAKIVIDPAEPLNCLNTIQKIIERCSLIKPDVKNASLSRLKRYFLSFRCGRRLSLNPPLTVHEINVLERYKARNHKKYSRKAVVILMANQGCTLLETMEASRTTSRTIYRWLRQFKSERLKSIETRVYCPARQKAQEEQLTRVIDIIHKSPSLYGINRTTWTYGAISQAYQKEFGQELSSDALKRIIKKTGYSWHHARKVLTSPDPDYKAKVEKILDTLQGLRPGEAFFFIDEVGPYQVKKYGGKSLMANDQIVKIPEFQKSKGKVIFAAALEALSNQMTWVFTADKSSQSFITLIEKLAREYAFISKMYLTWDALSVHSSKAVMEWIDTHNQSGKEPGMEVVPLPANSQFLNVIEAVFGGMKRAVIVNSDYSSVQDMQAAMARHFEERNQFYRDNPKRAGNKIWDKQAFDLEKLAAGLFKKM